MSKEILIYLKGLVGRLVNINKYILQTKENQKIWRKEYKNKKKMVSATQVQTEVIEAL